MDAISVTPKLHRAELLEFVHQPELVILKFQPSQLDYPAEPQALRELDRLYSSLNIEEDPYVVQLRSDPNMARSKELYKVLQTRKTFCSELIKKFRLTAHTIYLELGLWAVNYFIDACIRKFQNSPANSSFDFGMLQNTEKSYLRLLFGRIASMTPDEPDLQNNHQISSKVHQLIEFLNQEGSLSFVGLIFVETRAAVAVLARVLSVHARTKDSFTISTFVGASSFAGRKSSMSELLDLENQKETLDDLRSGRTNLVVTTNALEEGIDVSACNNVICFNGPTNLVSFVQRRGRARKSASKYSIMYEERSDLSKLTLLQRLEEKMKQAYMNEMRQIDELQALESMEEEGYGDLVIEATGYDQSTLFLAALTYKDSAKLLLDDAVRHLYHFCATLPTSAYANLVPIFMFSKDKTTQGISAKVVLPNSVDVSVREANSRQTWATEKSAKKDAAFVAYVALYYAGLVNENLLPLRHDEEAAAACSAVDKRPSLVVVPGELDLWSDIVAQEWEHEPILHKSSIFLRQNEAVILQMSMLLPQEIMNKIDFALHWDATQSYHCTIEPVADVVRQENAQPCFQATDLLLRSVFGSRMESDKTDFACLFIPSDPGDLQAWVRNYSGRISGYSVLEPGNQPDKTGLVRDSRRSGAPFIFQKVERVHDDAYVGFINHSDQLLDGGIEGGQYLKVMKLSKRADFLHRVPTSNQAAVHEAVDIYLPAGACEVDNLPFAFSQFALFIPSIMHQVNRHIIARNLSNSILSTVKISDLFLINTALSTSVAREPTSYQRLEFLGDSVLKYFTSLTVMAGHLTWHEGILSGKKDHLVSNARLASAALELGLAKFIRTTPFTGRKWRPLYNSKLLQGRIKEKRQMSTKTLADVVESLIGAAFIDGGSEKALSCLEIFLPEVSWDILPRSIQILYNSYQFDFPCLPYLAEFEHLIGYSFNLKTMLLEALTHPTYYGSHACASYQRLEFLGDSILDNIVVTTAYNHEPPIPTPILHLIRTNVVNASFLAFLCLSFSMETSYAEVVAEDSKNYSTIKRTSLKHIWQYMRLQGIDVRHAQNACLTRYDTIRHDILMAIDRGAKYPWALLARLNAPKFFSDLIESLLGAIYIDTHGSWDKCRAFLDRLGLMTYLQRLTKGEVKLLHPKEELGQIAIEEEVKYIKTEQLTDEDRKRFACRVFVGKREVASVGDGVSKLEVEIRGAEEAVKFLKETKQQAVTTKEQKSLKRNQEDMVENLTREEDDDADNNNDHYDDDNDDDANDDDDNDNDDEDDANDYNSDAAKMQTEHSTV